MRFVFALAAACLLASAAAAQTTPKIGYVNLQVALNESSKGKQAKEQFKKEVEAMQKDLERQRDGIEALKSELEKKASVMKESELASKEDEYRRKLRDFERNYKDSQADLQRKDNELTAGILSELQEVVIKFGEREGYTLILETTSSAVLYGAEDSDLTDRIIREYNGSR